MSLKSRDIKNKKNENLTQQEDIFRQTFENAAVGMAHVGRDGHFIRINRTLLEITGYPEKELLNKTFQEITHPEDLEEDIHLVEALSRGEIDSYAMEKRYFKKNGDIVWVKLTVSAVNDAGGDLEFFIAIIEDISKQKQTEETLRKNEERLRKAFQIDTVGVLFFDMESNFLDANDTFLKMIGHERERLEQGELNSELVTLPEWMPRTMEVFMELKETGRFRPYEKQLVRPDGSRWWGLFAGIRLDENEAMEFVIDITERKRAEETLQESEEKFRLISNNISQLVWMGDNKGRIFWFNKRWFDYTGYTLPIIDDWHWNKLIHPDHRDRVIEKFNHSLETGQVWEELFPLKDKKGRYCWFLSRAIPLKDREKNVIRWFGTATDVSKQIEIEDQLKKDKELLENLLYIAAHDLKGPVGNLQQALDFMRHLEPEKKLELLGQFQGVADQLDTTIKGVTDILRVRNTDETAAERVSFEDVLNETLEQFKDKVSPSNIKSHFSDKNTIRYIKPFLQSIMKNLIGNSIKYSRKDVTLRIEISTKRKGNYTLLSIHDNGIGIDLNKYGDKLFSPFHRFSSGSAKGTGIGLYLINNIIKKNGGYIKVESEPGIGTSFYCYLKEY